MNKQELIDNVAAETGETKKATEAFVNALTKTITDELKAGGEVSLHGIGTIHVANRAAKTGRHPKTGAEMAYPAAKVPKFKASKILKDALNK